ncbi:hypothetical protein RP20_CCG014144 [Aedes albopictus]|nr:hypothetical protein RP20_CCG020120 [Aedes albopictus]KXJ80381.1 hypothetical protein RP20_CCG024975 [Aedes albopictus]KXJ82358.1 hypothetical protein RP20_CCG014144 [Aedes albopictus]
MHLFGDEPPPFQRNATAVLKIFILFAISQRDWWQWNSRNTRMSRNTALVPQSAHPDSPENSR